MNTLQRLATYILTLAVGLGAGFYFGTSSKEAVVWDSDFADLSYYRAYMETQLTEGTDAAREEAIHTYLALIEKRKTRPSMLFTKRGFAIDSALSYARLAALAKKRGAIQDAQHYLALAESFCPQIGWQKCSADKITHVVQRLDKQGLFTNEDMK